MGDDRKAIERYRERIRESDEISEEDKQVLLETSKRLDLVHPTIGHNRHKDVLGECTRMAEEVGGLARALEDREATEELVRWIKANYDNEYTDHSYRTALRSFAKHATDGEGLPESVEWVPSGMSRSHDPVPNPADMLDWEDDVVPMIDAARNPRDAALIAVAFDTGARASEVLDLSIGDVSDHQYGLQVFVDGKTGQRPVTLIPAVPYLQKWLADHPAPDTSDAPLWSKLTEASQISYQRANQALKKAAKEAGVTKPVTFTNFRKSNATHLVRKGISQPEIEDRQGRKRGSDATAHYIARFGGEADDNFARVHGVEVEEDEPEPIGPVECPRCDKQTPRHKPTCVWCSQALDHRALHEIEQESRDTREVFLRFAQDHPEILEDLQTARDFAEIVEENPDLIDEAEEFVAALEGS